MRLTELKFQQQLIDDIKKHHRESYAIKVNHRFLAGIPDLLIKHPHYSPMFIETKLGKVGRDGIIQVGTTGVQRNTMRMMARSGLIVAVWTLVQNENHDFIVQSKWDAVHAVPGDDNVVSRVGKTWPIERLLNLPVGMCVIS